MFTNGTATGALDLLDKLNTWLTGTLGWSSLKWDGVAGDMIVAGPGTVTNSVIVRCSLVTGALSDSWLLDSAVNYDSSLPSFKQNIGALQDMRYYSLGKLALNYWFYGNSRQFKVVAKSGTFYLAMYGGFHLPFALPDEYPWPLYLCGNTDGPNKSITDTDARFRNFWDPGLASMKTETLDWITVSNHQISTSSDAPSNTNTAWGRTFPYIQRGSASTTTTYNVVFGGINGSYPAGDSLLELIVGNKNGERPIFPIEIQMLDRYSYGSLDGVFCVPGSGLTPEQTITWTDGTITRTFRVFPNIYRQQGRHWAAFEEI